MAETRERGGLGVRLQELFQEAEAGRRAVESRWLGDLRRYKGIYDPEVMARLHPLRSKAFLRLTRTKVRAADARLMDLLFPGTGERNWAIEPTPVPEMPAETMRAIRRDLARESGREADHREMDRAVAQAARRGAEAMSLEIEDQLCDVAFREIMRSVIHSGNLYGTGVLKGPLVERRARPRWEATEGGWSLSSLEEFRPFVEFVPLWDVYPDMAARSLDEARFVFQRHQMSREDLLELAARPDFDGQVLEAVLAERPGHGVGTKGFEGELASMGGSETASASSEKRYEVLEYWGNLDASEVGGGAGAGGTVQANVWLAGGRVIKAVPAPIQGVRLPYFLYYFDKDETSIFGEGLASIMRDPQTLINASVRAMLDNAAICTGPQVEVNQDLLPEGEDISDVYPFRIWLRSGAGESASNPAIRVTPLPSYTEEFMAMAQMFERLAHEVTGTPSSLHLEYEKDASRTARGLSMLLAAAGASLKDQVKLFDDHVTRPFITAMYHWNMAFNPKEEIKGDFTIRAKGFSGMVSREVHVQELDAFADSTANSLDAPWVRRGELLRRRAEARGLGQGLVRSDEELVRELEEAGR